jgi:hypothetical protein
VTVEKEVPQNQQPAVTAVMEDRVVTKGQVGMEEMVAMLDTLARAEMEASFLFFKLTL